MITSRRLFFLILLSLILGLLIISLLIPFWVAIFKDEKEVVLMTNKKHQEIWSVIQKATTTLLPMNSSATNLAKIVFTSLDKTDVTLSHIQSKVAPILFQALLTIPRVSQISYIRKDGLFFALYSQADRQIFAVYSNTTFSKHSSAKISYPMYTQRVDRDTGKLYGEVVVFPTLANETWLQQALNTTNGLALLGNSWTSDKKPLVLNIAQVDNVGVVSVGCDLKWLVNVFSGIKTFGGGMYLATKDGNVVSDGIPNTRIVLEENTTISFQILEANGGRITLRLNYETPKTYVIDVSGTKYVLYPSSLDINGMQMVYVLALPYDEVQSKIHQNLVIVSVLSSLAIVTVIIFIVLTMISARKEKCLTTALVKQMEKTQQLERKSKNQSVAFETASHNIRASLAAISESVEMSINENHQGTSELATNLRIIQSSTKYLQGLLTSILDASKIEAGKMELEEKPFDLVKVLKGVVDLFYPIGLKKGVDVILDLHDDLLTKYSQVKGDEHRLKQILSNLLSNAIKFTPEGHVSLRVRARARAMNTNLSSIAASDHGRYQRWRSCLFGRNNDKCGDIEAGNEVERDRNCMEFVFEVNDTGKGIAKEKRASIFENYVQVKETEHEYEGTGLWLAIVRSLVQLMGGEISIIDKEAGERGTCFRFHTVFKVIRSDLHGISDEEKVNMSSGSNTGSNSPLCSPKRKDHSSSTVVQAHGLDAKQLPQSDVIIPMPLHGSQLDSLLDLLPHFSDKLPCTPPHSNSQTPVRQVEVQEITRVLENGSLLRGKKILLVEDNAIQQMTATRIFWKNGVIFDTCSNGKEALTFVSKGLIDQKNLGASHILPYDYILMDYKMPVMDGCEATKRIRLMEKDFGVHTPIIGVTAHVEGVDLSKFVKGVDTHVFKPLNEDKLLKVIEDLHSRY